MMDYGCGLSKKVADTYSKKRSRCYHRFEVKKWLKYVPVFLNDFLLYLIFLMN